MNVNICVFNAQLLIFPQSAHPLLSKPFKNVISSPRKKNERGFSYCVCPPSPAPLSRPIAPFRHLHPTIAAA